MKSTRAFLEDPFKPSTKPNQARLGDLEHALDKTISLPEDWYDSITQELMDHPCNIKLVPHATDYYVDKTLLDAQILKYHPLLIDTALHSAAYKIDKQLANRIKATLTIEEMKHYVRRVERARQIMNSVLRTDIAADDIQALVPLHSRDILKNYDRSDLTIPPPLLSALSGTLMTLPVRLNGECVIDFFEVLITQPLAPNETTTNPTEHTIKAYLNPFTQEPIESIEIDAALLFALDSFLERARIYQRLQPIYEKIRTYDALIKQAVPQYANKTCMEILAEKDFPPEKIPPELMVSIEPGSAYTRVATHPVVLDGSYSTDFLELIKYWDIHGWGRNPSTLQPIHSISYHSELKDATNLFVLNDGKNIAEMTASKTTFIVIRDNTQTTRLRANSLFKAATWNSGSSKKASLNDSQTNNDHHDSNSP